MSQPWERRADETPKAFAAFCVYRDMGPGRSLLKAYRQQTGNETATLAGYFAAWSSQYDWEPRAAAWDEQIQERVRIATEDATVAIEKRLIEAAYDRMLAEVENGAGDWRAALETLKRRKRDKWGDNVSIRADQEARRIIAEMFGEDATGDTPAAEARTSQA